jgi:hypothetical protein
MGHLLLGRTEGKKKKNKEAVASSLAGEKSAALPVVGEKGGGGGFYRRPKATGGGLRKPARRRARDGSEMVVGCSSGRGVTGLSGRGLTGGGGAGVWRLVRGTATGRWRRGLGSCWCRRRIDSNGGAAHRRTKKVARGGAPAVRTRARPRRGEEARRCFDFGDEGAVGSVSAMPGIKKATDNGVARSFVRGGDEVARRRSCGASAIELLQR